MVMTPVILIKKVLDKKGRFFVISPPPFLHFVHFTNFPHHERIIFKETFSTH